jgi:hypothetical protein
LSSEPLKWRGSPRSTKLVATGTEAPKALAVVKADLVQAQLQSQKDVFDGESTLNVALRARAAAERSLSQAGLDPAALETTAEVAIVVAQVPESKMTRVREGEPCEARFYALPDHRPHPFAGAENPQSPVRAS